MLGLLNLLSGKRRVQPRSARQRTARLWLERLESRDCPSAGFMITPTLTPTPTMSGPILTMSLTMNGEKSVTLRGSVTDENPAGLTVGFTGAVNATAVTDADGFYSLTLDADHLGTLSASTVDGLGETSNTVTATVVCAPPAISNFSATVSSGVVTLTGTLSHPDTDGMTVSIQGVPPSLQNTVTTLADEAGNFSYSFNATANDFGLVHAASTDCWGQQSNDASFTLHLHPAPVVTESVTMNGLKSVTLTGSVFADNPAGVTVIFTGAVNATTVTDVNGQYSLTLDADHLGDVVATTVDGEGQSSNSATATVAIAAPLITNFTCEKLSNAAIFTGKVSALDAVGMTVTIQGAPTGLQSGVTTSVGADGTFRYCYLLVGNETGTVEASCFDCWGQESNPALTFLS